jgi:D-methionine transport system permease protein
MSLFKNSFWAVFLHSFSKEIWDKMWPAIGSTLYMVSISAVFVLIFGTIIGIILAATRKTGLIPSLFPANVILSGSVNVLRSLPEMIIIIVMLPLARLITGQSYGSNACIIALVASCVPMFSRLVESILLGIDKGKIEAAKAMGSGNFKILFEVMVPETFPALIRAYSVALIALISMTALAGNFGAGGIGDLAVRYGFSRFQHDILFATIYALVIMVMGVQFIADLFARVISKKWHII